MQRWISLPIDSEESNPTIFELSNQFSSKRCIATVNQQQNELTRWAVDYRLSYVLISLTIAYVSEKAQP